MATMERLHSIRAMSPGDQAIAMAVAVLYDRIQRLSDDDRKDLMALIGEFAIATNDPDREGIVATMLEIFESPAVSLEHAPGESPERHARLQRWSEFVGKRVRDARDELKMTQEQLSEQTGLPQSHISRIECGHLSPSRITLEKIAKAVGKQVEYFDCLGDSPAVE